MFSFSWCDQCSVRMKSVSAASSADDQNQLSPRARLPLQPAGVSDGPHPLPFPTRSPPHLLLSTLQIYFVTGSSPNCLVSFLCLKNIQIMELNPDIKSSAVTLHFAAILIILNKNDSNSCLTVLMCRLLHPEVVEILQNSELKLFA